MEFQDDVSAVIEGISTVQFKSAIVESSRIHGIVCKFSEVV